MASGSRRKARTRAALAAVLFAPAVAASFAGGTGTRAASLPSGNPIARPRGLPERRTSRKAEDVDPPEVQVGERLFLETPFAQYFFARQNDVHPLASNRFKTAPLDLGLWNVYANPDFPAPQAALEQVLGPASADSLRDAIARFKTSGLRDLGQSGPYLHTGRKRELEEVLELYVSSSTRERQGRLRNGDPALAGIFLGEGDLDPLVAFLSSLNEDYN